MMIQPSIERFCFYEFFPEPFFGFSKKYFPPFLDKKWKNKLTKKSH